MLIFSIVFLLLPNSASGEPGRSDPGDVLRMIHVLTRHGDRASQSDPFITATAPLAFYRGLGELTDAGISHAIATGKAYRDAYVSSGHLDGRFLPSEATFRASGVNRVLMTGGSFSSGLFRGNPLLPVHAPLYTTDYEKDDLLAIDFSCENGWNDMKEKYQLNNTVDMSSQLLQAMRSSDEWKCAEPESSQSDTVLAEFANQITRFLLTPKQVECARDEARKFMFQYILRLGGSGPDFNKDSQVRLQRSIGNLTNLIVSNFQRRLSCSQTTCEVPKAVFLFAHDVNQLALMNVVSMQQGAQSFFKMYTPEYASSLSIELWSRGQQSYVRMYVKDGMNSTFKEFDFCQYYSDDYERVGNYCSLSSLERAKNLYIGTTSPPCLHDIPTGGCCPTGGVWSEWSSEGVCSKTCGSCATLPRTRTCVSEAYECPCTGETTSTGPCGIALCPFPTPTCCGSYVKTQNRKTSAFYCGTGIDDSPTSCCKNSWSEWSEWTGTCLKDGGGTRSRICEEIDKGCPCEGEATDTEKCCCPSEGIWGEWSAYRDPQVCGDTCGSSKSVARTRTCISDKFGCACKGTTSDTGPCDRAPCDAPNPPCADGFTVMTNPNNGVVYCGNAASAVPLSSCCTAANAGTWSTWTSWTGRCDVSPCGHCDKQERQRTCTTGYIGCPCDGDPVQSQACGNNSLCPDPSRTCCAPYIPSLINGSMVCA